MSSSLRPKRFNELLPTIEEVKEGTPFYSDHLPIMTEMPMGKDVIKMVTWNVHAPSDDGSASGYDARETDKQVMERGKRSIAAIMKMIDENDPVDMILLQETYFFDPALAARIVEEKEPILGEILKAELDKRGWDFKENGSPRDPRDLVTLYNKKRVTLTDQALYPEVKEQKSLSFQSQRDLKYRTQKMEFVVNKSNQNIVVHNAHWDHNHDPKIANQLLTIMHQVKCITAGDFNHRIVQPGKKFLPSNVVPIKFRKSGQQGVDYTDGFFFTGEDGKIHHPKATYTLNPETGKQFVSAIEISLDNFTEEQQLELLTYHPFVNVAEEHVAAITAELTSMIGKESLIFLNRNDIFLRLNQTVQAFNEKKLTGVTFLLDYKNSQHVDASNQIKILLADKVDSGEKDLTLPVEKLKQALLELRKYYSHILDTNRPILNTAVEHVKKAFKKLNADMRELEKAPSKNAIAIADKTAVRNYVQTLIQIVEDWATIGSARDDQPFARRIALLNLTKPAKSGFFSKLSKVIAEPDVIDLLKPLEELDKQLVYLPCAELVCLLGSDKHKEEVEEKVSGLSLSLTS